MGEFVLVCLVLYILYECTKPSTKSGGSQDHTPIPRPREDGQCYCSCPGNVPGFCCTKCGGVV